jgi:Transcription factor WhiB
MTTATQLLHLKLVSLAKQELYPNCAIDSHLWLSDFEAERAEAVKRCRGCVVLTECAAMADEVGEKHYVFGGKDRTRKPKLGRPKKT